MSYSQENGLKWKKVPWKQMFFYEQREEAFCFHVTVSGSECSSCHFLSQADALSPASVCQVDRTRNATVTNTAHGHRVMLSSDSAMPIGTHHLRCVVAAHHHGFRSIA